MENNRPRLDLGKLNNIGTPEFVKAGGDSNVFRVKNDKLDVVAKKYEALRMRFGQREVEKILRDYYAETERAQKILEQSPNPLNQKIFIEGLEYDMEYTIVPQGGVLLEADSKSLSYSEKTPLVIGQKFKEGLNYNDLNNSQADKKTLKEIPIEQKLLFYSKDSNKDINKNCRDLFDFLNKELGVDFSFAEVNIKPYLNTKERKLKIVITDLASSLVQFHEHNKKYRNTGDSRDGDSSGIKN